MRPPAAPSDDGFLSEQFLLEVLGRLVATPSVNPGVPEIAMAREVERWLEPTGAQVTWVEVEADRPSLAAVIEGRGGGPTLVLNGHTDTVPVEDPAEWSSDPFHAVVRDGQVFGRGACDMKAGLAIEIAVARHLASRRDELQGRLVLHFAMGEESAEPGTLALVEAGFTGDAGIVLEPTELRVATAQRGAAFLRVRIHGRSGHAGTPHRAVNPLAQLGPVLEALEEYGRRLIGTRHPLLGEGTCTPTVVRAGEKENMIAGACDVIVDRRLLPGETAEEEARRLADAIASVADRRTRIEVAPLDRSFEPSEIDGDAPLAQAVRDAIARVTGAPAEPWGTPFASDVRNLINDAGMEAVTFGPGAIENCHCVDEHVPVRELMDAAMITASVAQRLLLSRGAQATHRRESARAPASARSRPRGADRRDQAP